MSGSHFLVTKAGFPDSPGTRLLAVALGRVCVTGHRSKRRRLGDERQFRQLRPTWHQDQLCDPELTSRLCSVPFVPTLTRSTRGHACPEATTLTLGKQSRPSTVQPPTRTPVPSPGLQVTR